MIVNRKMVSDGLIVIGLILGVIGWGGKDVQGPGGIISWSIIILGGLLILFGILRYVRGHVDN